MKKKLNYLLVAGILTVSLAMIINDTTVYAASSVNIMFGQKSLDGTNTWESVDLDSQREFGLGFEHQKPEWPVAVVASFLTSKDSASEVYSGVLFDSTGKTSEIGLGIKKYLNNNPSRFFVEGGVASIKASVEICGSSGLTTLCESESDSAIGYWFGAGVDVKVSSAFSVGLFARMSDADTTILDEDTKAGGLHFAAFGAYHFGK